MTLCSVKTQSGDRVQGSTFHYEQKETVGNGSFPHICPTFSVKSFLKSIGRISFYVLWVPYLWEINFVHLSLSLECLLSLRANIMFLFLGFTILFHTYIDTTFIFQCQTPSITLTSHLEDEALPLFCLVP